MKKQSKIVIQGCLRFWNVSNIPAKLSLSNQPIAIWSEEVFLQSRK